MPWGFAAAGIAAAGALYAGMQANQQAQTQSQILNQQAQREREQAAADEQQFRDKQARALATRRAIMGGSGVDLSTGSPLLADEDFTSDVELQALKIRNGGEVNATRLEENASLISARGNSAQTASYFRAGSLLVGGADKSGFFKSGPTVTGADAAPTNAWGGSYDAFQDDFGG